MNLFRIVLITIFLSFPVISNWSLKHPWPNLQDINDAIVLNEKTIIAVGEDGIIIKTHNGGDYWKREFVNPLCGLNSIGFWDSLNGIICLDSNYLYKTNDGGKIWLASKNNVFRNCNSNENLTLFDDTNGWLTINKSVLLSSKNKGLSWDSIYTFSEDVSLLKFTDNKTGIAVTVDKDSASYSNVYMSFDGGNNWVKKISKMKVLINSISSIDSNNYALFGINYYGYKIPYPHPFAIITSNCWKTYDTINFHNATFAIFNGQMINKDTVSLINDEFKHYYGIVSDSGWYAKTTKNKLPPKKGKQIKDGLGVLINENGNLLYTRNGGKDWTSLKNGFSSTSNLTNIFFMNSKLGWASGYETKSFISKPPQGILYKTLDGGERWQKISQNFSRSIIDIEFANNNIGWLIFGDGNNLCYLQQSINGGLSWTALSDDNKLLDSIKFRAIDFITEDVGFIVGKKNIVGTRDGGKTWSIQNIHCDESDFIIKDIKMTSLTSGWITGEKGFLLKTSDGGGNWFQVHINTVNDLNSISFINDQEGWVAAKKQIFRTSNGGIDWVELPNDEKYEFIKILFLNPKQGIAINNKVTYNTNDGGNTWSTDKIKTKKELSNICISESENVWASGESNGIYHRIIKNIETDIGKSEKSFTKCQSYINFFNPSNKILFQLSLKRNQYVTISFFTLNGRKMATNKYSKYLNQGDHLISFEKNCFSRGVYIAHIKLDTLKYTLKFVIN